MRQTPITTSLTLTALLPKGKTHKTAVWRDKNIHHFPRQVSLFYYYERKLTGRKVHIYQELIHNACARTSLALCGVKTYIKWSDSSMIGLCLTLSGTWHSKKNQSFWRWVWWGYESGFTTRHLLYNFSIVRSII